MLLCVFIPGSAALIATLMKISAPMWARLAFAHPCLLGWSSSAFQGASSHLYCSISLFCLISNCMHVTFPSPEEKDPYYLSSTTIFSTALDKTFIERWPWFRSRNYSQSHKLILVVVGEGLDKASMILKPAFLIFNI